MRADIDFTHPGSVGQAAKRGFDPAACPRAPEGLELAAGEVRAIDARRRRQDVIRCLQGRLWLTQAGDPQDHLLRAGDVFLAVRPGRILVSALKDARLEVASTRNGRC